MLGNAWHLIKIQSKCCSIYRLILNIVKVKI